jgi:hypothetical protein
VKHIAPQFELPGGAEAFNLSGEVLRAADPIAQAKTWDDVENARDLFTGPQSEISKAFPPNFRCYRAQPLFLGDNPGWLVKPKCGFDKRTWTFHTQSDAQDWINYLERI